jgi:nicotinate-nucleotide adenylyltransferase
MTHMRIGILGGTFNPIHIGHLILAQQTLEKLKLNKVIFVPTYIPPHKGNRKIASAEARFKMAMLATQDNSNFEVSDLEIRRKGRSYSIYTLEELRRKFGVQTRLFFIVGADLLDELYTWKDIGQILKIARFVAVTRPGYELKDLPAGAVSLSIPSMDISSTQIRGYIKKGKSIRYLVTDKVLDYILRQGLYR